MLSVVKEEIFHRVKLTHFSSRTKTPQRLEGVNIVRLPLSIGHMKPMNSLVLSIYDALGIEMSTASSADI